MIKKMIPLFMGTFLFLMPVVARANPTASVATFTIGNGKYSINGMVKNDTAPYVKNGRTYLPLRYTAYALGIGDNNILWDATLQTAYLQKNGVVLSVKVGESYIFRNRTKIPIDAKADYVNNRVMLPLRAIGEAFNCNVQWNAVKNQVTIIDQE